MFKDFKAGVFDWNETILDAPEIEFELVREILKGFGITTLDKKTYFQNRWLGWFEILHLFGVPRTVPGSELIVLREMNLKGKVGRAELREGVSLLLDSLKHRQIKMEIVSSEATRVIESGVIDSGLSRYFHVLQGDAFDEVHYESELRKAVTRIGLRPADCFYLGGTLPGLTAAKNVGLHPFALCKQKNGEEILTSASPEKLFRSLLAFYAALIPQASTR